MITKCWFCGGPVTQNAWRNRRYCDVDCRKAAWRKRKREGMPPVPPGRVVGQPMMSPESAAEFAEAMNAYMAHRRASPGTSRITHGKPGRRTL